MARKRNAQEAIVNLCDASPYKKLPKTVESDDFESEATEAPSDQSFVYMDETPPGVWVRRLKKKAPTCHARGILTPTEAVDTASVTGHKDTEADVRGAGSPNKATNTNKNTRTPALRIVPVTCIRARYGTIHTDIHTQAYTHRHIHTQAYIHTHRHTHTQTYTHRHTHTDIHTQTYTHKHIHTHRHTHTHTHTQAYTHTGIHTDIHTQAYTHTHRHTHRHTHTGIHTQAYTQTYTHRRV